MEWGFQDRITPAIGRDCESRAFTSRNRGLVLARSKGHFCPVIPRRDTSAAAGSKNSNMHLTELHRRVGIDHAHGEVEIEALTCEDPDMLVSVLRSFFRRVAVGSEPPAPSQFPGGDRFVIGGYYDDRLVRTGDVWLLEAVTLTMFWQRGNRQIMELAAARGAALLSAAT